MSILNQVFNLKLWVIGTLIVGTSIISIWVTTVIVSTSTPPQLLTCPPCKPAVASPTKSYNRNVDRVPNDNGKTY